MTYTMSQRARSSYNKRIKDRNRAIGFSVAVFFICLNILIAIIFWPMLKDHLNKIERGERKPIIEIRID